MKMKSLPPLLWLYMVGTMNMHFSLSYCKELSGLMKAPVAVSLNLHNLQEDDVALAPDSQRRPKTGHSGLIQVSSDRELWFRDSPLVWKKLLGIALLSKTIPTQPSLFPLSLHGYQSRVTVYPLLLSFLFIPQTFPLSVPQQVHFDILMSASQSTQTKHTQKQCLSKRFVIFFRKLSDFYEIFHKYLRLKKIIILLILIEIEKLNIGTSMYL